MNDTLLKFKEVIDEEIEAYESLKELYKIKQSFLIQGKNDSLWDVDAQIIEKAKDIKDLNQKRKNVAKYLGNEELTMTEAIEKAKDFDNSLAKNLESQKIKLKLLSKTLDIQEKTNMTLIQHGLIMVRKTLDIIVDALLPEVKGQYNKNGENIKTDKTFISSIEKEA